MIVFSNETIDQNDKFSAVGRISMSDIVTRERPGVGSDTKDSEWGKDR
jgi:hypothetical protein